MGVSVSRWVMIVSMLLGLLSSLLMPVTASAQVVGATLTGTVADSSGGAIPGAQLSVKNVATGVMRNVTADSAGFYTVPNLTPGSYEVTITAAGFATQVRSGLTLTVGAQQQLNVSMQVGQVSQKVEVTGEAPQVQTTSSEMSAEVNEQTVVELPLNGRSWTDLTVLQRGVSLVETNEGGGGGGCLRGCGAQLVVAGARPQQNNYRLDGISIMDQYNAGPGSELGVNLGVDAIQEFSVVTNNYSTEYGRTSGGVVNAVTKVGTNQFHGDVYEFLRNSALDARSFFDPVTGPPPFRRNQFGASAGGPIQKDKTFIFGDYEGVRQTLASSIQDIVPSLNARSGNLTTGTVTVAPIIKAALALWPLPNVTSNGDSGTYRAISNQVITENFAVIRVDRTFSAKDSIAGTYKFDRAVESAPDAFLLQGIGNSTQSEFATISETHVFSSTFVNTARFGYTRNANLTGYSSSIINPEAADPTLETVPGAGGMGIVGISGGFSSNPGGKGSNQDDFSFWNTYQYYDDAFVTRGAHALKFGFAAEHDRQNYNNSTQPGGIWAFPSLAAFLQDEPSNLQAQVPGTLTPRHVHQTIFGGYVQDDWRFRPSLTFNMGLRYEMLTVPYNTDGKVAELVHITDVAPQIGNPWFLNPTKRNFEPRVGFAWDPFHDGKSSVRGGFGVFDVLPTYSEFTSQGAQPAPFFEVGTVSSNTTCTANCPSNLVQGDFPMGGFTKIVGNPKTFRALQLQYKPKRNYMLQWNLDLQHQVTPSVSVSLGYIGSRGVHQPFHSTEVDEVLPTLTSAGYLWPAPLNSGTRINTNWGDIKALYWIAESNYNGLVASIEKRISHGVQVQASFTWSKSLDDDSSSQEGNGFTNAPPAPDYFDLRHLWYGPSDFNIPRTLIVNGLWMIPGSKSNNFLVQNLSNGWQVGGIFKANDGPPMTVTWGTGANVNGAEASVNAGYPDRVSCSHLTNPGNFVDYVNAQCFSLPTAPNMAFWTANCDHTTNIYGTAKTVEPYPICFNLRGNSGRNILKGPGFLNTDMSLFKNNYVPKISESFNIQFRFEAFNVFNRPNFQPPGVAGVTTSSTDVFNGNGVPISTFGQLTGLVNPGRELQFALKVIW